MHLVFRLRGGGYLPEQAQKNAEPAEPENLEISLAPGGNVKQVIETDTNDSKD
jgi:hypothetical protein